MYNNFASNDSGLTDIDFTVVSVVGNSIELRASLVKSCNLAAGNGDNSIVGTGSTIVVQRKSSIVLSIKPINRGQLCVGDIYNSVSPQMFSAMQPGKSDLVIVTVALSEEPGRLTAWDRLLPLTVTLSRDRAPLVL